MAGEGGGREDGFDFSFGKDCSISEPAMKTMIQYALDRQH